MNQDEQDIENFAVAQAIRKGLGTPGAKKALELLKIHFNVHITSAALARFEVNQTFYQDGSKAVFFTIDQILNGELYGTPPKYEQPESNEQTEI